jgi:hypothetical protein
MNGFPDFYRELPALMYLHYLRTEKSVKTYPQAGKTAITIKNIADKIFFL